MSKKKLKIFGIDPGTATTGWGLITEYEKKCYMEAYGCIETSKDKKTVDRLVEIANDLEELLDAYKPDEVAIEELFFFKNAKTVITVSQARGVMLLVCSRKKIPISEYTPLQIKQALTGYGRADKFQVQCMVREILELRKIPKPDDAADALAVALCHQQSRLMKKLSL